MKTVHFNWVSPQHEFGVHVSVSNAPKLVDKHYLMRFVMLKDFFDLASVNSRSSQMIQEMAVNPCELAPRERTRVCRRVRHQLIFIKLCNRCWIDQQCERRRFVFRKLLK